MVTQHTLAARSDVEPSEIRAWLEWASSRLLAMKISSPAPKEFRVAWPEYAHEAKDAYNTTPPKRRAAIPSQFEITLMDEILVLPGLVPDVMTRRIINARSLVMPVSNRHVYSWERIAVLLHSDRKNVARRYLTGLKQVASALPVEKANALRKSFSSLAL